jgi:hypothetical protein
MTVSVNGPTNVDIVPLSELAPYQAFADPKFDRVYIFFYQQGSEVECLRISPTLGRAVLGNTLPVRRIHLDIDWSYE